MPSFLHPKRSGVHRLACLSLYHALLKQCAGLTRVNVNPTTATRLVKQQFRKLRDLDSPTRIINALRAGRETLDLIHACANGCHSSLLRLTALTAQTKDLAAALARKQQDQARAFKPQDPSDIRLKRRAEGRARRRPEALRPHPDAQPIITSRPRPQVPGVRRIPVFVNARGVPYLRIKKPQPPSLSRALRSYLDNRWARIERRERLEGELLQADSEDQWDAIVRQAARKEGHVLVNDDSSTWKFTVSQALRDTNDIILKSDKATAQRAEDMFDVVLREKELKRQEKEARRRWWAENMEGSDREGVGSGSTSPANSEMDSGASRLGPGSDLESNSTADPKALKMSPK